MNELRIADTYDDQDQQSHASSDEGLKLIAEIERLQDFVLDELESLNGRIQSVFRSFGYKEVDESSSATESNTMQ